MGKFSKDCYAPIIFSAIDKARPYPQLNFKDVGGFRKVYSRTNYNLFLQPSEAENLSWKIFLEKLDSILGNVTNRKLGEQDCHMCARAGIPCRLYIKSVKEGMDVKFTSKLAEVICRRVELWSRSEVEQDLPLSNCALVQALFKMTETGAERKFLADYIRWLLMCNSLRFTDKGDEVDLLKPVTERFAKDADYLPWQAKRDLDNIVLGNSPALVPQVWLNYIYNSHLGPKDPERAYLRANPSRVDFIMLWQGMRHAIEIDGPEHYASFKGDKYVIDEEQYTKNLMIERSLWNSGWIVHRFSNLEVLQSKWFGLSFASELGVSSFHSPWWQRLSPSQ
jgi:hypothetical protein